LYDSYGGFIDAIVGDALYANGPVMTQLTHYGYGGYPGAQEGKERALQGSPQPLEDRGTV